MAPEPQESTGARRGLDAALCALFLVVYTGGGAGLAAAALHEMALWRAQHSDFWSALPCQRGLVLEVWYHPTYVRVGAPACVFAWLPFVSTFRRAAQP